MAVPASSGKLPSLAGSDWLLRPETRAVFAALAARGFEARAVGGAVRNALLGRPVVDIDIATPARPEDVIAAAKAAGLAAVPTGIAHGTVTVVANHVPHQVTTLREDVETHGRHARVAFTGDWAADARRRDFTLNALYCSAEGEVLDPLSGYADLAVRRVRFIGDARERIREDYLRILRFFRLTAEYGEGLPDAEGLAACVREREGLARLSAERVREELMRLLVAGRGSDLVRSMFDYGLLTLVLAAAPRPSLLDRLASVEAALGLSADAILHLGALAVEVAEDADRLRDRLRLSNEEHARLARLGVRVPEIGQAEAERAARARLYAEGTAAYADRALMSWARSCAPPGDPQRLNLYRMPERWQAPRFPLSGDDVMALGIAAGPRVGQLLRAVEAWWIAGDFVADAATLREKLRELAGRT